MRRGLATLGAAALGAALFTVSPAAAAGTGTIAVCLTSSTGANLTLPGDQASYQVTNGPTLYVGAVGGSGCRESTVPADTDVKVWVLRDETASQVQTVQVAEDAVKVVNFYTTKVTAYYPGDLAFGGPTGGSKGFVSGSSKELLSFRNAAQDPLVFRLGTGQGYARTEVSWPIANSTGKSATFTFHAIRVLRNDGSPIEGVDNARKYTSGGYHVKDIANPDETDANGFLAWTRPGLVTSTDIEVRVNGTIGTKSWDPSTKPLQVFQTTNVTLNYNRPEHPESRARYFFNDTNALWFDSPSKEMFAGEYPFQFYSDAASGNPGTLRTQTTIDVPPPADGPITKTAVVVRLQDSEGNGLKGSVSYYKGGWSNNVVDTEHTVPGSIPAGENVHTQPQFKGSAVVVFDGAPKNVTFAITNKGARQQLAQQNVQSDSTAYFHTVKVTVTLRNDANNPRKGGAVSYYTNSWRDMDDTDANGESTIELLPSKVSFAVVWRGSRQQKTVNNVGDDPSVTFKTVPITVHLEDHAGSPLEGGAVTFYSNSWRDMGDTDSNGDATVELLPSKVSFAVVWLGSRQQKTVNDISDSGASPVVFQTSLLVDDPDDDGIVPTSFYTTSWQAFPEAGVELLPSKVSFKYTGNPQNTINTFDAGEVISLPSFDVQP